MKVLRFTVLAVLSVCASGCATKTPAQRDPLYVKVFESDALFRKNRVADGERVVAQTLAVVRKELDKRTGQVIQEMTRLAIAYRDSGKYREAESVFRTTLLLAEQRLGKTAPGTRQLRGNLIQVYEKQGKRKEALALKRQR